MRPPLILDLFCGAGGCSVGYARAGFEVVGVDVEPQPNYPFSFICADALDVLIDLPICHGQAEYVFPNLDAVHASPPCQAYSKAHRLRSNDHPDLIHTVRKALEATGLPWVIENVPGAPLFHPVELCGTMFGLPLYRHRWFETNWPLDPPLHGEHYLKQVKMGRRPGPDELHQPVGNFSDAEGARRAMGTPWMTRDEMAEAVPPAYTEYVGAALMSELSARRAAA